MDKLVKNVKKKLDSMSRQEQISYLSELGFKMNIKKSSPKKVACKKVTSQSKMTFK